MRKIYGKKGESNLALWVIAIGILIGIAFVGVNMNIGGSDDTTVTNTCETEPYIEASTFNFHSKSSALGPSYSYIDKNDENGIAQTLTNGSSGDKFSVGDELTILSSLSGYIDTVEDFTVEKCGSNKFTNFMKQADAITIDILDDRNNEVTDSASGGATNLTDGGSETSANFIIEVKGARDKTTGQVLLTLEVNDTEVDDITIKPNTAGASVLDESYTTDLTLFTSEGTAPVAKFAFLVDEVDDGGAEEYLFTTTAESGENLGATGSSGFLYVNAYAGQWYVDTDGSVKFGFEDADGTLKYEQKATDHDALFS